MKRILLCAAAMTLTTHAYAGGRLEQIDLLPEQTFPGLLDANVVPIFWDDRCTSIEYTMDETPANHGTPQEIPVLDLVPVLQDSFDGWNDIRTSYIEMNITQTREIGNGVRSFDFINELTFETPSGAGYLASSPSVSLIDETTFVAGDDIDGDGDSDVFDPAVEGRNTCFDADGDGDIEFPAGDYAAGTILDNDVQFNDRLNAAGIFWNLEPKDSAGQPFRETDLKAVAIHEFGHSHGLSHSMINQISSHDGTGSTMFPFVDIDDAASEAGQETLHTDDIAWSSFIYPEGTAPSGPAAIQHGDIPFKFAFQVIKGSVSQNGLGVLGASVQATTRYTGETLGEGYSGFAKLFVDPASGGLLINTLEDSVIDGDYEIPVPRGLYDVHIEALDGAPAASSNISLTAQIGDIFGQQSFAEEYWSANPFDDELELFPGLSIPVFAGFWKPVNFVTNSDIVLNVGATEDFIGSGAVGSSDNVIYASRFSHDDVLAILENGGKLTTGLYHTAHADASHVPIFKEASLVLGTLSEDGQTADLDLYHPLARDRHFVGQDDDLSPMFYDDPVKLSLLLEWALEHYPNKDVFLVLKVQDGLEGPTGLDPLVALDAIDEGETPTGNSFLSVEGGPFEVQTTRDWIMELRFTEADGGFGYGHGWHNAGK